MIARLLMRLARALLTLLLLCAAALALLRAVPGGPFDQERQVSPAVVQALNAHYGLDQGFVRQYLTYVGAALRGDLGPSFYYVDRSVSEIVADGLSITLPLAAMSLFLAIVCAVLLSWFALSVGSAAAMSLRALASALAATPKFALAPLLVVVFALWLPWLPAAGLTHGWKTWVLPVLALSIPQTAILTRALMATWSQCLEHEAVRLAALRGYRPQRLLWRHAGRLALPRGLAFLTPIAIALFTGSAVIETVFSLPGLGRTLVQAAQNRDYPLTLGVVLTCGALVVAVGLIIDALQAALSNSADASANH